MNIICVNCQNRFDVLLSTFVCTVCCYLNPLKKIDFFSYMGLPKNLDVDLKKLELQFNNLMIKYHPDSFVNKTEEEKINSLNHGGYLNEAYDVLKNETSRFAYLYEITNKQSIVSEDTVNNSELFMEFFEYYEELESIQNTDNLKIFRDKLFQMKQNILKENINIDFLNKEISFKIYVKLKYIDKIIEKSIDKII